MKRIATLWKADRRKVLMSLCALAVASAIVMSSGANFTSASANPGNVYTAGDLKHTNSAPGAILVADKMKPGESRTGTVNIKNTGDIDGVFTLSQSNLTSTANFDAKLGVKVDECNAAGGSCVQVYSGKLNAMTASVALDDYSPLEEHQYKFTVTFPDADAGSSPATKGSDNAYKGATASVKYNWESVNN